MSLPAIALSCLRQLLDGFQEPPSWVRCTEHEKQITGSMTVLAMDFRIYVFM